MKNYLVIVEGESGNYAAYSPDVPGCVAAGETVEETLHLMVEAIEGHLEALVLAGQALPRNTSVTATFVAVPSPQLATVN